MSRLDQILTFTNVAAGDTVDLPHDINVNGTPVVPDFAFRDNGDFSVDSVDETTATVTNNGSAPATLNLYLWRRHTHERNYGAAQINNLVPQPFVPAAGGGGGLQGIQAFLWTSDVDDTLTATIPLPVPRADANYQAHVQGANVNPAMIIRVTSETDTDITIDVNIGLNIGDTFRVIVVPNT